MMSVFLSTLLLVATACTEFRYEVSFFSTLLLVATGATARKEFSYDISFLEHLATGCYSLQGV